jgi:NAD+ synthase (glutamine-hydrolysing)
MKIALAQLNYHIGNFEANSAKIKAAITDARKEGADLVVFSELSVCGYPPQDLLEFDDFISRSLETVEEIAAECRDIAAIVGAPSRNEKKGKKLFNSAFLLAEGKIDSVVHKGLLPTYDVFEEYRHFEPETSSKILTYKGFRIALTICEDLWNLGDHPLYTFCPMDALIKANPHVMLNIAASPFSYEQQMERRDVMLKNVEKYGLPLLYINHVGAQTDLIFDGGSLVIDSEGELLDELQYFEEDLRVYELTDRNGRTEITKQKEREATYFVKSKTEWIYEALVLGIRDYFAKMGFRKAVLGLSGGIDSAVVLALAERALGNENVYAILLPSQFSSDHSVKDSQEMCRTLHVPYDIIPIKDIYNAAEKGLHPLFRGLPFGITEENLQARIRGLLLMAISNKQGYILLNTTNKSEMATKQMYTAWPGILTGTWRSFPRTS